VKRYIDEARRNGIETVSTFEMIKGLVESWKESIDLKRQRWGRRFWKSRAGLGGVRTFDRFKKIFYITIFSLTINEYRTQFPYR